MKKSLFIVAFCLAAFANLFAQDWSNYNVGKKYPGYMIMNDGTKQEGFIEAQQRASIEGIGKSNQTSVVFWKNENDKKSKDTYKPNEVKEYMFDNKIYRSMNYTGGLMGKPMGFLLLVKDGHIAQYAWYSHDGYEDLRKPKFTDKIIFQKGNEKPIEFTSIGMAYARKMSELVSDNKELADKVSKKEKGYGVTKLFDVIDEYNKWYEENNKK